MWSKQDKGLSFLSLSTPSPKTNTPTFRLFDIFWDGSSINSVDKFQSPVLYFVVKKSTVSGKTSIIFFLRKMCAYLFLRPFYDEEQRNIHNTF